MTTAFDQAYQAEDWTLYGFHYQASRDTANRIGARVFATTEWLEHEALTRLIENGPMTADATLADWRKLAREEALAFRALYAVAARIVQEETSE